MKGGLQRGFAALPLVSAMALIFTLSLLMLFRAGMLDRDQVARRNCAPTIISERRL